MSELSTLTAEAMRELSTLATEAMSGELSTLQVVYIAVAAVLLVLAAALGLCLVRRAVRGFTRKREARAARKREAKAMQEDAKLLAAAPRSPWDPAWRETLAEVMPVVPEDNRQTFLEAVVDLANYNLLQPPPPGKPVPGGGAARRRQWHQIAGGQAGKLDVAWIGIGVVGGAIAGLILGLQAPPVTEGVSMSLVLGILLAPIGGTVGHVMKSKGGGFHDGMMQVIVNERRSVIRTEMVTGQVEAWIPKALLFWRSNDWRYRSGKPYLWLMLPYGERIQNSLKSTLDYLRLPNDPHRAKDAAVYAQRSWNRMLSDNALDFADIDKAETGDNRLKEYLPWLSAVGIVGTGILLVLLTGQ